MQSYERAGLAAEWEETVRQIRTSHSRKTGFLSRFEALAEGTRPRREPSFLDRAKKRWRDLTGHHRARLPPAPCYPDPI
ncbi:hypothetical protein SBA4_1920002 [Candidatus Sulfopaludibacter sp. SbA4]|nr:hypothetical protein SBA4_1920002 [Candidatus Sulfopaludibacter sp. SbA4]